MHLLVWLKRLIHPGAFTHMYHTSLWSIFLRLTKVLPAMQVMSRRFEASSSVREAAMERWQSRALFQQQSAVGASGKPFRAFNQRVGGRAHSASSLLCTS